MTEQTTLEERFGKCPYATAQSLISGKGWLSAMVRGSDAGRNACLSERISAQLGAEGCAFL